MPTTTSIQWMSLLFVSYSRSSRGDPDNESSCGYSPIGDAQLNMGVVISEAVGSLADFSIILTYCFLDMLPKMTCSYAYANFLLIL